MKLYGHPNAPSTQLVAFILHEKRVPFEFHSIDLYNGEQNSPEYRKLHPFGKVPYIDDEGFILYESRAIGCYIATKYASRGTPGLIPTELKQLALFEQAVSVETSNFTLHAIDAIHEVIINSRQGIIPDPEKLKSHIDALSSTLDVYDQILSKQKYVAGDSLTLADLFHIPYAEMLPRIGSDIMLKKPNVARWYTDITSRPAWKLVVKNKCESVASYE